LTKFRVIVADDSPLFLQKLISLLAVEFDVVATAADGKTALNLIRRYEPDLVVLDLNMPGLNGIEVARELAKNPPSPLVVICSAETDSEIVEAAREAGAVEYVFKSRIEKDLILAAKSAVQDSPLVALAAKRGFDLTEAVPFAR
jgi:DNA-binding NarL/FixJ family response regulator